MKQTKREEITIQMEQEGIAFAVVVFACELLCDLRRQQRRIMRKARCPAPRSICKFKNCQKVALTPRKWLTHTRLNLQI